jgi:hypothetical protein
VSEQPGLTCVLPNYNHAKVLPRALESLFAQTRPADEVLVVDDGSTDDSAAVVQALAKKHPALRLIRREKNGGTPAAQNTGLAEAKGRWIHFAASDDTYYPGLFEKTLAQLERREDAALCSSSSDCVDDEGRELPPLPAVPVVDPARYIPAGECLGLMMRFDSWIMGNTCVYRTDFLREEGGLPEQLGPFADGILQRVLALKRGVCFVPERLAVWRRSPGGFATRTAAQLEASLKVIAASASYMREKGRGGIPESYVSFWEQRAVFETLRHAGAAHGAGLARAKEALREPSLRARAFFALAAGLNCFERMASRAATASWSGLLARRRGKMEP